MAMVNAVMIIMIIVFAAAFAAVLYYCINLKNCIKKLAKNCNEIKNMDTNTLLVSETLDKDIISLICSINQLLLMKKDAEIKSIKTGRELKQAITNISHDLRTPLTSAIGYIQMAEDDRSSPEKKKEYLSIIELKLKTQAYFLDELFTFTKIIEGKIELNIEKINIANCLRDSLSVFYNDFLEKNIHLNVNIPDTPVYIFGDIAACNRVIQNLIQNVLRHGKDSFELELNKETSEIIMKNNVCNIKDTDISRVFERFYTSDNSRSGKNTGLGLAIAKELMELMGGELEADTISNDTNSLKIKNTDNEVSQHKEDKIVFRLKFNQEKTI